MKSLHLVATGVSLAIATGIASAQTGSVQQMENVQNRRPMPQSFPEGSSAPELYSEEASDVGPQYVLKIKPRHKYFQATADVQYFYTDNMFLTEDDPVNTDVLVSTAEFALAPTPYELAGGTFAPRIGYQHQWYNFGLAHDDIVMVFNYNTGLFENDHLNVFDFNVQTIFTDAQWSTGDWTLALGFDFRRMMDGTGTDEFYREYVPRWGAQRIIPVGPSSAFTLAYAGDYRWSEMDPIVVPVLPTPITVEPDLGDRTDHMLFLSYTLAPCSHASIQPYYQFKYTRFVDSPLGERNDILNTFGLALYWTVCPNFEVRAFANYNIRNSDNSSVSEYREFDGGAGMNVTFRF